MAECSRWVTRLRRARCRRLWPIGLRDGGSPLGGEACLGEEGVRRPSLSERGAGPERSVVGCGEVCGVPGSQVVPGACEMCS